MAGLKGRGVARILATAGFLIGVAVVDGGSAQSIGGLCIGRLATHTWLDASGQYGPALIDGTDGDDTIIGSDGDDTIDAHGGNDNVCGAAGDDSLAAGDGDDAVRGDTGDDDIDGGPGVDTLVGDGGNDTVAGGPGRDNLYGGSGDDVLIGTDDESERDRLKAGEGFDVCLFGGGDRLTSCEY
jgi:Ca2+-binding RTX toxin-like protein